MSNRPIKIDPRWKGMGGIGTFYEQINKINQYQVLDFEGSPASPLDTVKSSIKLSKVSAAKIFFPGYIPPLLSKHPYVITIHDLNHLDRPENSSLFKKIFYNLIIKRGCKKAEYIFTVSEFSKRRIVEWSGISSEKVINVGNGVSSSFHPDGERYDVPYDYLLCVSNRKLHKNEEGTLKAFKAANIDTSVKLVFTGKEDEHIRAIIKSLELENRVIFTGFLPEEELPKLYRTAKALLFVSFYEGFGLPIVEAQASGIPVITADNSSLAEIAGDAAVLVNAVDIDSIAKAITDVYHNEQLRNDLVERGFNNKARYSWEATASIVNDYMDRL